MPARTGGTSSASPITSVTKPGTRISTPASAISAPSATAVAGTRPSRRSRTARRSTASPCCLTRYTPASETATSSPSVSSTPIQSATCTITNSSTSGTTTNTSTSIPRGYRPRPPGKLAGQPVASGLECERRLVLGHRGELVAARSAQLVDLVQGLLEHALARPDHRLVLHACRLDPLAHLLHLALELLPLIGEAAEQGEDLVGCARELEVLDHLPDQREHHEKRDRRAEHDPLLHRIVEHLAVVLVDEGVQLVVRDEQQHEVDRAAGGIDVVAAGELLDPRPYVAEEVVTVALALELRRRVAVAQVVVERELHIHVQDEVVGEEEREVGYPPAALDRALLAVVDVLDEVRDAQHVLGHALTPTAPRLRARQHLPQALGRLHERAQAVAMLGELRAELAQLPLAVGLEFADQTGETLELGVHVGQRLLAVEVLARELALRIHQRLAGRHDLADRGPDRRVPLLLGGPALLLDDLSHLAGQPLGVGPAAAAHPVRHDGAESHSDDDRQHQLHAPDRLIGV